MVENNKFNIMLSEYLIATQIALLLNSNNKLKRQHNTYSIIKDSANYFIELQNNNIVGCIGLINEPTMDRIIHLSVNNKVRKLGIGNKLLTHAINISKKDIIYMHVREDNTSSLNLAFKNGFKYIAYIPKDNYNILTLCLFRRSG